MSKAVEGAAMLAGAVGMGAVAFLDPAVLASPLFLKAWESLVVGGIAMEASALASALTGNRGMGITTRQAAAFRQLIYGEQRVPGIEVYRSTTGSEHDQFNYMIVIAGHEVDSFVNLYLDGRQVYWLGSGAGYSVHNGVGWGGVADNGTHIGPGGAHYNFGGTGHSGIYAEARFGDQTDGDYIAALTANDANWGPDGLGNTPWGGGCACFYLKIEYSPNLFPAEPEIRTTVRGKNNIYDPRTATSGFTNNWALVVADVIQDTTFGLGDTGSVNMAQLIAAANVCDEQVDIVIGGTESRYCCDWHYDSGASPGDVLQTMMPASAGRLSRIGGEWFIWPAYWQGPSFSFDQSILTDTVEWSPYGAFRELINRVNGTYIAPNSPWNVAGNLYDVNGWYNGSIANQFPFAFTPTSYPQYAADALHGFASDAFLAEDGGIPLPLQLVQNCVLSVAQAQRVAKITLFRNRQQGSGTIEANLNAWQMQPLDVMLLDFPAIGWMGKQLEITRCGFSIDPPKQERDGSTVRVQFSVQETDESTYEWTTAEELTVYDVPGNPAITPYIVDPPTDLSLLSDAGTAVLGADGINQPRILATWIPSDDVLVTQTIIQYRPETSPATDWITAATVSAAATSFYIAGVVAGVTYDVEIQAIRANGAASVWVEVDGVTAEAPNSLQSTYTNNPQFALTQPTSTTIDLAAVAVSFGGATPVNYDARSFTISAPSVPTVYYVTIADPTQRGDGSPLLSATCQTSNAMVGIAGNVYMGAILALPAGGAVAIGPGGWPAPQSFQVVS